MAVSPWRISTSSTLTPKESAAICDQLVTCPWPWGEVPVTTSTCPEASMWTLAISQPLPPVRSPASTCEGARPQISRSEEHTSELQSRQYLVCRLLLEKKK